ncbi:hypothetical protein [Streptomyces sp. NPDC020362]
MTGSTAQFVHRMLTDPHHSFSTARCFDVRWFRATRASMRTEGGFQ